MSAKKAVLAAIPEATLEKWRVLGHCGAYVYGVWAYGWLSSYCLTANAAWQAASRKL